MISTIAARGTRIVLLFAVFLAGCSDKGDAAPHFPPVPVVTAPVAVRDAPKTINAIGNVKAFRSVTVRPRVTGIVQNVLFKKGTFVKTGTILFEIDTSPFKLRLDEAAAKFAHARSQADQAKRELARIDKLISSGTVSREEAEEKQTASDVAESDVLALKAELDIARQQLEYCTIVSPIDGIAGRALIDAGNLVRENQDMLLEINQIRPIYVDLAIPEKFLDEVRNFQTDDGLTVTVLRHGDTEPSFGRLSFIDNRVNQSTGMVTLEAVFPNDDELLWPGQFVNAALTVEVVKNAVLCPARAIQNGPPGRFVFIVEGGKVDIRVVEPDFPWDDLYVVSKGLVGDEIVVTDGQLRLRPGAPVVVPPPAGSPAPDKSVEHVSGERR